MQAGLVPAYTTPVRAGLAAIALMVCPAGQPDATSGHGRPIA
jgi:hypothetical protein